MLKSIQSYFLLLEQVIHFFIAIYYKKNKILFPQIAAFEESGHQRSKHVFFCIWAVRLTRQISQLDVRMLK